MFINSKFLLSYTLVITISVVCFSAEQNSSKEAIQSIPKQNLTSERFLDLYVVDRSTNQPLPDVNLEIRVNVEDREHEKSWKDKTDTKGHCIIMLPDMQINTLRLYPRKEGFVPLFIMWRGVPTPYELPKVFTVTMEPSTTIGGLIQNEQGEPIEDVIVGVHYQTADPDAAENVHVDVMIHNALKTDTRTDATGRWSFDRMPANINKNELRIFLKHPRYLSDDPRPGLIPMPITPQPPIEKLRDLSSVMVMKKGIEVTGTVTDKSGKPIAGAKIYDTDDYWWRSSKPFAETDTNGQFRSNASPGMITWTVQAGGYAPDLRVIQIKEGMLPVQIRLEPGNLIEGTVTDQAGKPIEGAWISAEDWRQNRRRLHLETKTDAEGNFKITDAPADEITFNIGKEGYMMRENFAMKPDGAKYSITLRPPLKVHGEVLDADTGRPIDKFTVTNGFDHEDGRAPQWDKYSVRTFTGGQYEMEYRQEIFTYRLRIDAEGYQSALSPPIRPEEIPDSNITYDFKLEKAAPLEGTVLSPDGAPLSDAEVVIATDWLRIVNGKIESRSSGNNRILRTDINGRFRLQPPVSSHVIIVLSEQGYAKVSQEEFAASRTITVIPWGRIEGTLRIGAKPGVDKLIVFLTESNRQQGQPNISFEYEVQTNEEGHFVFPHVVPGKGTVARATPIDERARRFSYHLDVEVKPGQTAHVQIGGTGCPVIGKVVVPDMIKNVFEWQYTDKSLRISSPISPPYKLFTFECDKDGSFRVEDVPAGDYCVYVHAYGPPPNPRTFRGERIGELSRAFSIPAMPGGRSDEPLDLGTLELEVINKAAFIPSLVGKALPELKDFDIDQSKLDTESKIILVCFFDMEQRPSRNCIMQLSKRAQELQAKEVVIVVAQASKIEQAKLEEWVKENNISFPVGMIEGDSDKICFAWGVKSLPWLILTDKQHIITAEGLAIIDLDEKIKELENAKR
jgi:protocatechuate 3,4-dioxygenase beta subunit